MRGAALIAATSTIEHVALRVRFATIRLDVVTIEVGRRTSWRRTGTVSAHERCCTGISTRLAVVRIRQQIGLTTVIERAIAISVTLHATVDSAGTVEALHASIGPRTSSTA